jgi:radical SAM superfamily enzyme YgiQ (UPF0313 family)
MRVLLISANREQLPSPVVPIGVLSVAGAIREQHEVRVVDVCFEADPIATVEQAIAEFRPEVVGVGLRNLHTNAYDDSDALIDQYAALTASIRRATKAPLVLGGGGFSLQPSRLVDRLGADYGVVGEGEYVFPALLERLASGAAAERLMTATSVLPRAAGPLRLLGKGRPPSSDLDTLPPPARDLVDLRYYELDGTDNVQTKRGCAFQCTYCDYPDIEGRTVRVRDPETIADEVLARSRVPGVTHVFFVDSVFNVPPAHALAVCDALIARGTPVPWVCYGTPAAFPEELVSAMARAGCQGVEIGSDAGTERLLKRLKKPFKLDDILRTRELFLKYGILDSHTFVIGAEDETVEEAEDTLKFVEKLDPDLAVFIVFMEDREERKIHRARHRDGLLELLRREAPKHPSWIVPELGIRFGVPKSPGFKRFEGPAWLTPARIQRRKIMRGRAAAPTL